MQKNVITLLSALALTAVPSFAQQVAKGYVYDDLNQNGTKDRKEKGIANVAVSDGKNVVLTNQEGYYELPVDNHCVIFVIKPQGYDLPVNNNYQPQNYYIHKPDGSPDFKYKGSAPTGKLPKQLNFALHKASDPEDFKFFVFGDPQPYSEKEVSYFQRAIVDEAKTRKDGISFGISMGDLVGDFLNLQPSYLNAVKDMQLPWYNIIGNHDRNYDAQTDSLSNETFEANFGPSTYAFQYGRTHFVMLDDIILSNPPKGEPYKGGLRDDQLSFVEQYMKYVPKNDLVILVYHIPLNKGKFDSQTRARLFKAVEGHPVFGISAHTHQQEQVFYGKEDGWNGTAPFHEYNVGTTCGDWYSGKLNSQGLPDATMRDGTPQGYAVVTISGNKYSIEYKAAGQPADKQITVYCSKVIPYKNGGVYPFYANVYMGSKNDVVEYRIDGGEWKKMRLTDEPDPTYMNLKYEWDRIDYAQEGYRQRSATVNTNHLWKGRLDETLAPGEHAIEIRTTNMFGHSASARCIYRTETVKTTNN